MFQITFFQTLGPCWRSRPLGCERGEARGAGRRERASGEPGGDPVKVEGRGWTLSLIPALSVAVVATLVAAAAWKGVGRFVREDSEGVA